MAEGCSRHLLLREGTRKARGRKTPRQPAPLSLPIIPAHAGIQESPLKYPLHRLRERVSEGAYTEGVE